MKVLKTVKMYINGEFQRSESGQTEVFNDHQGNEYARVCHASRKDFRNTLVAAKTGQENWSKRTAYNKSQIIYRMAEMLEGRKEEFVTTISNILGKDTKEVSKDIETALDTLVFYAGFCDKFQQILGAVNPINGPYHNFSGPEPMGVIVIVDSDEFKLSNTIDRIAAALVGGNSIIMIVSKQFPVLTTLLGEIFSTSDLPAGSVNLLSGSAKELAPIYATHREVRAISFQNEDKELYHEVRSSSIDNMKRIIAKNEQTCSLDLILNTIEIKTVWHPIGI